VKCKITPATGFMHLVSSKVSRLTIYECKSLQKKIQDQRAQGLFLLAFHHEEWVRKEVVANLVKEGFTVFNFFFKKFTLKNFGHNNIVDRIV
jgi:hypothetical protein